MRYRQRSAELAAGRLDCAAMRIQAVTIKPIRKVAALSALIMALGYLASAEPGDDWPMFRHDGQLSGASPLTGSFDAAPPLAWSIDLRPPLARTERARVADVDGDGLDEILLVRAERIVCIGRRGEPLWESPNLSKPKITDVRDFAGDGTRGILIWTDTGLERTRYMLSGKTGQAVKLYSMRNVFGTEERIGRILPNAQGVQICAWWSGEGMHGMEGSQTAYGNVFSFEKGVESPSLRFSAELTGMIFSPRSFFSDYDEDGAVELIVVSHQQAWMFNLASGRQEVYVKWPMIRTYSATLAMLPVVPKARPSLLSINPHMPGVERVDIVDGNAKVAWKQVVGGKEDQYQNQVKIAPGAPDPFIQLRSDGYVFVLASVTNERNDGETHLVVFDGDTGARLAEEPNVSVLSVDDLDGDGVPEVLMKRGSEFRITNWRDDHFETRWGSTSAEPLLVSLPSEGDLARSAGGNTPVWRESKASGSFLLRFADGVFACALTAQGVERGKQITVHPALHNVPNPHPPAETVAKSGDTVTVKKGAEEIFHYDLHKAPRYLAPPAVVADFGGERRVIVQEASGALVCYSKQGEGRRLLAEKAMGEWSVCDMDGAGGRELVAAVTDPQGQMSCQIIDPEGKTIRSFGLIPNAKSLKAGPTGSLGEGKGRWLAIFYDMKLGARPCVAVYDGKTGEQLWLRDHFEKENSGYGPDSKVKFVLHVPTAVYDFDKDGADDLFAASENFFGIISVTGNKELTPIKVFSDYIPGHWQAYANPIIAPVGGKGYLQVYHHHAFAQTILTELDGTPVWHWGLTRDTTASAWPGFSDLRGDGKLEIAQSQADGLLRVFDADATDQKCPRCPIEQPLTAMNHGGHVRWEMTFVPPVSDIATCDLDSDGRGELLLGSGDGKLYCVGERDGHGLVKWSEPLGRTVGSPVIADLDGDGRPEILVPVEDGRMACFKGSPR